MNLAASDIAAAVLTQTWQLTLLLLVVWCAGRVLRCRPQIGYVICLVIVCKCILPPVWSSPTSVFSWMQAQVKESKSVQAPGPGPAEETSADDDRYVFEPMAVKDVGLPETIPASPAEIVARHSVADHVAERGEEPSRRAGTGYVGEPVAERDEDRHGVAGYVGEPVAEQGEDRHGVAGYYMLAAWLAGAGLFLVAWGVQVARFQRRLHRYARLCTDPGILACVERLRSQLGIRRRVRVLQGDPQFQPCTFGLCRPTILLPIWLMKELPAERCEQVIAHEMIHIRRGDLVHGFLQVLAQAVWWFHPLVWWFNRLMTDLRERCCDRELIARLSCNPIGYAECLLQVLRAHRSHQSTAFGLATHPTMAGSRRFEQTRERIEEIMNENPQAFRRFWRHWLIAALLAACVLPGAALVVSIQAQPLPVRERPAAVEKPVTAPAPERLILVPKGTVTLDDINSPTSVDVSNDGKFVYMASFGSGTLNVFARDAATGKLTLVQTETKKEGEPLSGAVHIHLSPDNRYAAVSCIHDQSFILYGRDTTTGKLSLLDVVDGEQTKFEGKPVLSWTSDSTWSPDGKFLYVADAHGHGDDAGNGQGHIVVLQLAGKKLKVVQIYDGTDNCLANVRGLAVHPDGVTLFATSSTAGTLTVMNRNPSDGKLSIREVIGSADVPGLRGAMQVVCSGDGQFVYTSSGRFEDGNAVCAFKLTSDGKLKLIQSLSNTSGELPNFEGGNKIRISPDGYSVYVTGTNSNHIACLQRDPKSGKLALTEMIDTTKLPGSRPGPTGAAFSPDGKSLFLEYDVKSPNSLKGPNGLAFSPDGKHLYVTWEFSNAISAFVRQNGPTLTEVDPAATPPGSEAKRAEATPKDNFLNRLPIAGKLFKPDPTPESAMPKTAIDQLKNPFAPAAGSPTPKPEADQPKAGPMNPFDPTAKPRQPAAADQPKSGTKLPFDTASGSPRPKMAADQPKSAPGSKDEEIARLKQEIARLQDSIDKLTKKGFARDDEKMKQLVAEQNALLQAAVDERKRADTAAAAAQEKQRYAEQVRAAEKLFAEKLAAEQNEKERVEAQVKAAVKFLAEADAEQKAKEEAEARAKAAQANRWQRDPAVMELEKKLANARLMEKDFETRLPPGQSPPALEKTHSEIHELEAKLDKLKAEYKKAPPAPKRSAAANYKLQLLEIDLEEAMLNLKSLEGDYQRAAALQKTGVLPVEELEAKGFLRDKAKLAVKRAEVKLQQAKEEP